MSLLQLAYQALTTGIRPFLPFYLGRRLARGKEDAARIGERYGQAGQARPHGPLIWIHGASVGETLSALPLIRTLATLNPAAHILVTSGTITSARLLDKQLPARAFHQFIPLDTPLYARRFLDHWQPDAVLWLESELWPNLLQQVKQRAIPAVLLNGRITAKSAARWNHPLLRSWIRDILAAFPLLLAQSKDMADRYRQLGATDVRLAGNLKFTAPVLTGKATTLEGLEVALGERPRWVMASTHEGEEAIALAAHDRLKQRWPDILTLIVPRHPQRAAEILGGLKGHNVAQRSQNQRIDSTTEIYLADTMGELGVFYRSAPLACVGGSFSGKGGHNPIEAAQCGCAVLTGPDMSNFTDVAAEMTAAGALRRCPDTEALATEIETLLAAPAELAAMQQAALAITAQPEKVLGSILAELAPLFARAGVRCT